MYELMQADGERTFDAVSLDSVYNNHRRYDQFHVAVDDHLPENGGELELKVGDEIWINTKLSTIVTGFGKNLRTSRYGTYPISKVRKQVHTEDFAGFT